MLSKVYFDNYLNRLDNISRPQQSNPARKTVMERIVKLYQLNKINYDEAISKVGTEAFNDVIPRFQTIGTDKIIAGKNFIILFMVKNCFYMILYFKFKKNIMMN